MEHTALLREVRRDLEEKGDTVLVENQNHFTLRSASGVALGGKPDLVSLAEETSTIYDIKTGQPRAADHVQVMLYMYALPQVSMTLYASSLGGLAANPDCSVSIFLLASLIPSMVGLRMITSFLGVLALRQLPRA
jgi:hypothetical protein